MNFLPWAAAPPRMPPTAATLHERNEREDPKRRLASLYTTPKAAKGDQRQPNADGPWRHLQDSNSPT